MSSASGGPAFLEATISDYLALLLVQRGVISGLYEIESILVNVLSFHLSKGDVFRGSKLMHLY